MVKEWYSTFPKFRKVKLHSQIDFSVIPGINYFLLSRVNLITLQRIQIALTRQMTDGQIARGSGGKNLIYFLADFMFCFVINPVGFLLEVLSMIILMLLFWKDCNNHFFTAFKVNPIWA